MSINRCPLPENQNDLLSPQIPRLCWEGPQLVNHSLALVNREMELALLQTGQVNLCILPVGEDSFSTLLSPEPKKLTHYYRRRFSLPIDVHVRHQWPPNWSSPSEGRWVAIQPWEYGSLPLEWVQRINEAVDEAWVPSSYVFELFIHSGVDPGRVQIVPNGVNTNLFKPGEEPFPLPSRKKFKFLFVGGTIYRKGVDLLLRAYRENFNWKDDVSLVVKDMGTQGLYKGQGMIEQIRKFQSVDRAPEICYIDADLSDKQIAGLYNACDCLVHPYRGEGFGLPVLEAMACGLPVIVTAGGATDDFVNDDVGYRIPSRRQTFGNREISGVKTISDLWMLEPDVCVLGERMRWVVEHREESRWKGDQARKETIGRWTWTEAANRALERINLLCQRTAHRHQEEVDAVVVIDTQCCRDWETKALQTTLESLHRNSYAKVKPILWVGETGSLDESLFEEFKDLKLLRNQSIRTVLQELKCQMRMSLILFVSTPIWFSKQWLRQMMEISRKAAVGPQILAPSTNLENSPVFVPFAGSYEEFFFQKFARSLWRNQRGMFQEINSLVPNAVAVSRECLESLPDVDCPGWLEWISALQRKGCPTYWVKDTYLLKPSFRASSDQTVTQVN